MNLPVLESRSLQKTELSPTLDNILQSTQILFTTPFYRHYTEKFDCQSMVLVEATCCNIVIDVEQEYKDGQQQQQQWYWN